MPSCRAPGSSTPAPRWSRPRSRRRRCWPWSANGFPVYEARKFVTCGFQGREIGSQLHNPDFVKLTESFGAAAFRVTSPETLRPALDAPAVIEVVVPFGSEASPWDVIMPKGY